MSSGSFEEYAGSVISNYEKRDESKKGALVDAVAADNIRAVLDVGCGPGQDLLPFLERTDAICVGADSAEALGRVAVPFFTERGFKERICLVRCAGEQLPFARESFDLVLCRVALPYMDNRLAIAEMARVLRPGGTLLLAVHAPRFYVSMVMSRLKSMSAKQLGYPLICIGKGLWHTATGHQPSTGIWRGKEVFQTRRFLKKQFSLHRLRIVDELPGSNAGVPSLRIVKDDEISEAAVLN